MRATVQEHLVLPPNYKTVYHRTQLAQQLLDVCQKEVNVIQSLIREQHLMQLGWTAVVANFEDTEQLYRQRYNAFLPIFKRLVSKRDEYLQRLLK